MHDTADATCAHMAELSAAVRQSANKVVQHQSTLAALEIRRKDLEFEVRGLERVILAANKRNEEIRALQLLKPGPRADEQPESRLGHGELLRDKYPKIYSVLRHIYELEEQLSLSNLRHESVAAAAVVAATAAPIRPAANNAPLRWPVGGAAKTWLDDLLRLQSQGDSKSPNSQVEEEDASGALGGLGAGDVPCFNFVTQSPSSFEFSTRHKARCARLFVSSDEEAANMLSVKSDILFGARWKVDTSAISAERFIHENVWSTLRGETSCTDE